MRQKYNIKTKLPGFNAEACLSRPEPALGANFPNSIKENRLQIIPALLRDFGPVHDIPPMDICPPGLSPVRRERIVDKCIETAPICRQVFDPNVPGGKSWDCLGERCVKSQPSIETYWECWLTLAGR
jgi:hypothetical protein